MLTDGCSRLIIRHASMSVKNPLLIYEFGKSHIGIRGDKSCNKVLFGRVYTKHLSDEMQKHLQLTQKHLLSTKWSHTLKYISANAARLLRCVCEHYVL